MAEVGALRINLSLNSADFTQGIQNINRRLTALNSEFKAVTAGVARFDNSIEALRNQSDVLTRSLSVHSAKVAELRRQYEQSKATKGEDAAETLKLAAAYNRAVAAMNKTEEKLRNVNRRIQEQSNGFNQLRAEVNTSVDNITRQIRVLESGFAAATAGIEGFGSSTTELQQRSQHLTQSLNLQQQRVQELSRLHQESARAKGNDAAETQEIEIRLNRATQQMRETEAQLNRTTDQIQQQSNAWNRLQTRMANTGENLQRVGGQMQSVGSDISQSFGTAFLAVSAGLGLSAKKAMDFEQQMSSVYSVMAPDEVQAFGKELEELSVKLGADTKYSALEAAQGIEELIKAGVQVTDIINGGLDGALSLATAGELELADAAEIASTALNAFKADNLSVMRAADLLAGAANASATSVGELKYGLSMVSAVASGVGLTFEDTATALALFAQNGLKGSDAGTSLKTMLLNLTPKTGDQYAAFMDLGLMAFKTEKALAFLAEKGIKPVTNSTADVVNAFQSYIMKTMGAKKWTATADKAFRELGLSTGIVSSEFYDAEGNIKSMSDIAGILQVALKDLTNEQRQVTLHTMFGSDAIRAANILYKEGAKGIDEMATAMNKITSADVAAQKLDNVKGRIEELSGAVETAAISLGNALLPTIDKAVAYLQKMTDKFNSLSPSMQEMIVNTALVAAGVTGVVTAIGVGLAVAGAAVTGFGALSTAFGAVSGAIAAAGGASAVFGGALAALTGPVGLTVAGVAALTAGGIALYNHLQEDAIPEIDRFGESVSDSTKQALEGYFELSDGASQKLMELKLTQQKVSEETKNSLVETYRQMNEQILAKMDERHTKQLEKMQSFFMNSSALTSAEEEKIMLDQEMRNNATVASQENKEARIKEILEKAAAEKRALTESEQIEINSIQQQMNENAVVYLSKNELESKVILEKMKQQAGDLTARQAAEVVANSNKQRTDAVKEAEKQYEETLREITRMRDESGVISADQADKLIREATKQRDQTVKLAEDMHGKVVSEAKKQADEHIFNVDWETGQVLTKWESLKTKTGATFELTVGLTKKYWKMMSDEVTEKAGNLKNNAVTAFETLKNKADEKFKETKEKITKPIEEAKEKISGWVDDIKGFFANLKLKIPKIELPKMPKFSLTTNSKEVMGKKITYPTGFDVEWYAKGAVFTKPTIFNTPYGLKGFGEAGPEAALPLNDSVLGTIGKMIAQTMPQGQGVQGKGDIDINVYQTINSPKPLSPSETARLTKRSMQEAAFEWR